MNKLAYLGCIAILLPLCACSSTGQIKPEEGIKMTFDVDPMDSSREYSSGVLWISGSPEDVQELSSTYQSFLLIIGEPSKGYQRAKQLGYEGKLELPWTLRLNNRVGKWPIRVRLLGKPRDGGARVVIREIECRVTSLLVGGLCV